jgi:hypothetical protein
MKKGYKISPQGRENIRKGKIGNQNHLGYKNSAETKEKMRSSHAKRLGKS